MAGRSKLRIATIIALVLAGLAGLAALGLLVLLIVGLQMIEPLLERHLVSETRERGIALEVGELDWGLGWVRVTDSRFSLVGVRGIEGKVKTADIGFKRFAPVSIDAEGVDVRVEGSAAALALDLSEWTKNYPRTYSLRVVGREVSLTWQPEPGGKNWVELSGGTIVPTADGGTFSVEQANVAGIQLGKVGAAWTKSEAHIGLGFGLASAEQAPVRIRVKHPLDNPTADITLVPTDLSKLAGPLGIKLPVENVSASGTAHLVFPPPGERGKIHGELHIKLDGYVPPHPVELSGFIFGKVTTFDTKLEISEGRELVTLTESKVKAGAFVLRGQGKITRYDKYARVQLNLRGNLACTALADAAAQSRLGKAIGSLVGKLAKQALRGSVAVIVHIDGDTRDLAKAKVVRTIGVGCGLKPLDPRALDRLKELADLLGLPELPPIPSGLPSALPPLPSALPPLPSALPRIPIPLPDLTEESEVTEQRDAG